MSISDSSAIIYSPAAVIRGGHSRTYKIERISMLSFKWFPESSFLYLFIVGFLVDYQINLNNFYQNFKRVTINDNTLNLTTEGITFYVE